MLFRQAALKPLQQLVLILALLSACSLRSCHAETDKDTWRESYAERMVSITAACS
jgi:hypothetical protein